MGRYQLVPDTTEPTPKKRYVLTEDQGATAEQPRSALAKVASRTPGAMGMALGLADSVLSPGADAGSAALRGATARFSDYGRAAIRMGKDALTGNPQSFNDELKGVRKDEEAYSDAHPVLATGAEVGGAVLGPAFKVAGALAQKGVNAATRASSRLAQSVAQGGGRFLGYGAQGGAQGALAGAGSAEGVDGGVPTARDVAKSTAIGTVGGAALGTAVPAVVEGGAKLIGKTAYKIATSAPKMTQEQIKAASTAAYKASEDAGVVISPEAFTTFATNLPKEMHGYHPSVTDGAAKIVKMLQTEAKAGPLTLEKLDALRSVASGASINPANPNEARLAGRIVDLLDDFIEGLGPNHLVGGNADAAVPALKEARKLWKTQAKLKTISDIVDAGESLNDGNWVKGRFRAIVKSPKIFNRYTKDEQKLISDVARTGNLGKIVRMLPWRGAQMTTQYAEPLLQEQKIGALQDLVARGGSSPVPDMTSPRGRFLAAMSTPASAPLVMSITGGSNQTPYRER